MADWWQTQCAAWPYGERLLFTAVAGGLHMVVLYASCGLFELASKRGFWKGCLLPRLRPDLKASTVANVVLNRRAATEQHFGASVVTPALLWLTHPLIATCIDVCGPLPPARVWLRDIAIMIAGCDCIFYW